MTSNSQAPQPANPSPTALAEAWQNVLLQLKTQVDQLSFNAYIRDTEVVGLAGDVLFVAAQTPYARDWCASRLTSMIKRQIAPLIGRPVEVRFVHGEEASIIEQGDKPAAAEPVQQAAAASAQVASAEQHSKQMDSAVEIDEESCETLIIEEGADAIEAAFQQPGRIVAFPRYELRFIPLVGPENFFLRLAFLQERFFHTSEDGRAKPFETSVESLLRWANVGRATLHRFKKGDASRGQPSAAGWFGIEQLPSAPRTAASQQQPPCRYRMQAGIPLTPMDADRLAELLAEAAIRKDPIKALQTLCARPMSEIIVFPPPVPTDEQKRRAPGFVTVAQVVQNALGKISINTDRADLAEWTAKLSDHITMPHQMVHVSWYFLREWLPLLGHDAAALVLTTRAQGYYNPQTHELRDEVRISGGYGELARVIGLKRDRTIGDWLPNIFESQRRTPKLADIATGAVAGNAAPAAEKWQREQQRQIETQARIGQFIQVMPGSRAKMPEGHYAFSLRVEIKNDPLTPYDRAARTWVQKTLAACDDEGVLEHFLAWTKSDALRLLANNDGAGTLGDSNNNDVWGILGAASEAYRARITSKMTAGESASLDDDGWGILEGIFNDGAGILAAVEMTAGELFKRLLRLNTFFESIPFQKETTAQAGSGTNGGVVVASGQGIAAWDLVTLCKRNGGLNRFREQIISAETSPVPFVSWLLYAHSFKGRGIQDPIGWALTRLKEQPGTPAEGAYARLAGLPPEQIARMLHRHIEAGMVTGNGDWAAAFRDTPLPRLRQLAEVLGVG